MERVEPTQVTLKLRLEKNGRGGKVVTVLFDLPNNEAYFTELTKKLKNTLGSGGTFKNRRIEIQGDHKIRIQKYLENLGFRVLQVGA